MKAYSASRALRAGEWLAALVGVINCLLVPALFAQQNAFPLPALYFLEIALAGASVMALVALSRDDKAAGMPIPWIAAGILLAFVILGGFSIGPFLIPAFLAFVLVGLLRDAQSGAAMARGVGVLLVAAVVQAAVMLSLAAIF